MFFIGFFTGVITTVIVAFVINFYNKSERKDKLLAKLNGKDFEEKVTLKDEEK